MTKPRMMEFQLLQWRDGSNTGMTVKFQLNDKADLEYFKGFTERKNKMAGQLFAVGFVIADNQEEPPKKKTWNDLGANCQKAIALCRDKKFQTYSCPFGEEPSLSGAERFLSSFCNIASRKELDSNISAAVHFKEMVKDYEKWLEDNA